MGKPMRHPDVCLTRNRAASLDCRRTFLRKRVLKCTPGVASPGEAWAHLGLVWANPQVYLSCEHS
jgi:hypothetical protein